MIEIKRTLANWLPKSGLISFLYLTGGELLAEIEGESSLCYAGHLLLIPPGVPFIIKYYKQCTGYFGSFSSGILPDSSYIQPKKALHTAFWFDEAVFVGELFKMLSNTKDDIAGKALDLLLAMTGAPQGSLTHPLTSKFLELVFNENNPIAGGIEYAEQCSVSLNWLNRIVKKETGRSVGKWIDTARMGRAKRLLQESDMPVIDIAAAVGLEDQSYFSRFFKRNSGMTPSEFRKSTTARHE